ncbi:hypothetical protein D9M70_366540 [compost metagenome]
MRGDRRLRDAQPQSRAGRMPGAAAHAKKRLEQARQRIVRHAGAAVDDVEPDRIRIGGKRHHDRRRRVGVPDGVAQDVLDRTAERRGIGIERQRCRRLPVDRRTAPRRLEARIGNDHVDQLRQVEGGAHRLDRVQARQLQRAFDQRVKAFGLALDAVELQRQRGVAAPRQLQRQAQPPQRRAQFVRDIAQQLLAPVHQALQAAGHGVEIARELAQFVGAARQRGRRARGQVAGGERLRGFAQAARGAGDMTRQRPAQRRRHRQRKQPECKRDRRQVQDLPARRIERQEQHQQLGALRVARQRDRLRIPPRHARAGARHMAAVGMAGMAELAGVPHRHQPLGQVVAQPRGQRPAQQLVEVAVDDIDVERRRVRVHGPEPAHEARPAVRGGGCDRVFGQCRRAQAIECVEAVPRHRGGQRHADADNGSHAQPERQEIAPEQRQREQRAHAAPRCHGDCTSI